MVQDLERFITDIVFYIACAGLRGCLLGDVLRLLDHGAGSDASARTRDLEPSAGLDAESSIAAAPTRRQSTIWKWLSARDDICVGHSREFNHLSLENLLEKNRLQNGALNAAAAGDEDQATTTADSERTNGIRLFASEATQWIAIAGHAQDFKRVLPLEWRLLQAVASMRDTGILQGDLCRVANQDKRSVPKRTDLLVKKGYLTKRTTLVHRVKTSKIWLRMFAPTLMEDDHTSALGPLDLKLDQQIFTANLEPVAWCGRWTGESIDYTALSSTIMAVIKQWGVIRIRDLKLKLGVLGMKWHMKVLAKMCRILNRQGAIQYTAAKLEDRVFKDCVRFVRNMTSQDIAVLYAVGKRREASVEQICEIDDEGSQDEIMLKGQGANAAELATFPPWSLEEPLTAFIPKVISHFGTSGATNPDLIGLSLGPSFNRFMASVTATASASQEQPQHLTHLRLHNRHVREGKLAYYRFFMTAARHEEGGSTRNPRPVKARSDSGDVKYGFPSEGLSKFIGDSLEKRAGVRAPGSKPLETQRSIPQTQKSTGGQSVPENDHRTVENPGRDQGHQEEPNPVDTTCSGQDYSEDRLLVTEPNKHTVGTLPGVLESTDKVVSEPVVQQSAERSEEQPSAEFGLENTRLVSDDNNVTQSAAKTGASKSGARGRPSKAKTRGRGGAKRGGMAGTSSKPWICEKCGGSWKNDIGLKYHREKAKTTCNPNWDPAQDTARKDGPFRTRLRDNQSPAGRALESNTLQTTRQRQLRRTHPKAQGSQGDDAALDNLESRDGARLMPRYGTRERESSRRPEKGVKQVKGEHPQDVVDEDVVSSPRQRGGLLSMSLNIHRHGPTPAPRLNIGQASSVASKPGHTVTGPPEAGDEQSTPWIASETKVDNTDPVNPAVDVKQSKTPKIQMSNRISLIIDQCLDEMDGALPGADSLFQIMLSIWSGNHPDTRAPTYKEYQATLKIMAQRGSIAQHWHVIRNSNGSAVKCQIITRPEVDPLSERCLNIVEDIKRAEPGIFVPGQYNKESAAFLRPGRRNLSSNVSVLDAPVYAAQAVLKRALQDQTGPRRRGLKRRRLSRGQADGVHSLRKGRRRKRRLEDTDAFLGQDGIPDESGPRLSEQPRLIFLKPNTQLLDETEELAQDEFFVAGRLGEAFTNHSFAEDAFGSSLCLYEVNGAWPYLSATDFEGDDRSVTMNGWMPDAGWFSWQRLAESMATPIETTDPAALTDHEGKQHHRDFNRQISRCSRIELDCLDDFVGTRTRSAGPYNIFISFSSPPVLWLHSNRALTWVNSGDGSTQPPASDSESGEEDVDVDIDPRLMATYPDVSISDLASYVNLLGVKRMLLTSRTLTALPETHAHQESFLDSAGISEQLAKSFFDKDELIAAIVAVRCLLGGVEKLIDWGLLAELYPAIGATAFQQFWDDLPAESSEQAIRLTRNFQDGFIDAYEQGRFPALDFEDPASFDWDEIINWTLECMHQKANQMPARREAVTAKFSEQSRISSTADWRNDFFHVQSSMFARLEWVTSEAAAVKLETCQQVGGESVEITDMVVARSWIRSLCCAQDGRFSRQETKEKFRSFPIKESESRTLLLKQALDQLIRSRVVRRKPNLSAIGSPYQLTEAFNSALEKLVHREKYRGSARLKTRMDATFRSGEPFPLSFVIDDGAHLAVTNMCAAKRIRISATHLPDIPFGFTPGNYESRKHSKQNYHFGLQAQPTSNYVYNEDIDVLNQLDRYEAALGGSAGELPQWVNFAGEIDSTRWVEVLAAFCFTIATRGPMNLGGICSAMDPVLEPFEAAEIHKWGQSTGILKKLTSSGGITVGEWWWLAVGTALCAQ